MDDIDDDDDDDDDGDTEVGTVTEEGSARLYGWEVGSNVSARLK